MTFLVSKLSIIKFDKEEQESNKKDILFTELVFILDKFKLIKEEHSLNILFIF